MYKLLNITEVLPWLTTSYLPSSCTRQSPGSIGLNIPLTQDSRLWSARDWCLVTSQSMQSHSLGMQSLQRMTAWDEQLQHVFMGTSLHDSKLFKWYSLALRHSSWAANWRNGHDSDVDGWSFVSMSVVRISRSFCISFSENLFFFIHKIHLTCFANLLN